MNYFDNFQIIQDTYNSKFFWFLVIIGVNFGILFIGLKSRTILETISRRKCIDHSCSKKSLYRPKRLVSAWEAQELASLTAALPITLHACPQVRLADMIEVAASDPESRSQALRHVWAKSVDFAIIDSVGRVLAVIELNDRSHDRPDRQDRDRIVSGILGQCGIPMFTIRPGRPGACVRALQDAGVIPRSHRRAS